MWCVYACIYTCAHKNVHVQECTSKFLLNPLHVFTCIHMYIHACSVFTLVYTCIRHLVSVSIHACTCLHVCLNIYTYKHTPVRLHMKVHCGCTCMYMRTRVSVRIYTYIHHLVCLHVYIHAYTFVHIHVHVYVHIHEHTVGLYKYIHAYTVCLFTSIYMLDKYTHAYTCVCTYTHIHTPSSVSTQVYTREHHLFRCTNITCVLIWSTSHPSAQSISHHLMHTNRLYGVATFSRLLKFTGLFCKRAL